MAERRRISWRRRIGRPLLLGGLVWLACACSDSTTTLAGAVPTDALAPDGAADAMGGSAADAGLDAKPTAPDAAPGDATPETIADVPIAEKVTGTLRILHLGLPAGLTLSMGEATLVVGPDGTLVLIDVANGPHDDDIRKVVEQLNTQILTPDKGFGVRQPRQVEWLILTHYHGDHVGGFGDLLLGKNALQVKRGIVHRGPVDLGAAANEGDWQVLCEALAGSLAKLHMPLCHGASAAPCDPDKWSGTYPVQDCPGLLRGDLATELDDLGGEPAWIDLGGGARLRLYAADTLISDGKSLQSAGAVGYADSNEENARSLCGVIEHGAFRYHFGGDLTGSGKAGEPDVETLLAKRALPAFLGPLGADVAHVHHHARHTSSNATLVAALAPADGLSRNAVASINAAYLGSPHAEVVDAWTAAGRLGQGKLWCTEKAAGGADPSQYKRLHVLGATLAVETLDAGTRYRVGPWGGPALGEFDCVR